MGLIFGGEITLSDNHFKVYRQQTRIKHAILKDYLSAWVPILASWNKKLAYIDGFCGPGFYRGGEHVHPGSPIIALEIARQYSDKVELLCIFVDKKKEYCDELEKRACKLDFGEFEPIYYIACGTFEEVVTKLLEDVPNIIPSFSFIDPFGYSGLPLNVLKKFLERRATEALINFMYESISRFLSVPSQHSHLDELFGTDKWRDALKQNLKRSEKETFLRDLYYSQLKTCGRYVWRFKLSDPERSRTMYYLFHCTNHPKGIKLMKEIMYRKGTVGTYSYQGKSDSQISLFSAGPSVSELEDFLLEEFVGEDIEYDQVVELTLEAPFIDKHYREALSNLRERGVIRKIPVTTKGSRGFRGKDRAVFPPKAKKRLRKTNLREF